MRRDVAAVDPRIAAYTEAGKLEGVDYAHITAVDTAAIQAMQGEILQLKAQLRRLERRHH